MWIGLNWPSKGPVTNFCEHGNELSRLIQGQKSADWVTVEWRESAGVVNVDMTEVLSSFHPEQAGSTLLRNVNHQPEYTASHPKWPQSLRVVMITATCRSWLRSVGPTVVPRPSPLLPHFTLISPALSRCSETETVRPACQQFSQWHCQCRFSPVTQKLYPLLSKAFVRPSWCSSCQTNL